MRVLIGIALSTLIVGCANPYAQMEQQARHAAHYEAVTMCDQPDRAPEWKDNCYKMVMLRRQAEFQNQVAQSQAVQAQHSAALLAAGAAIASTPQPQPMPIARPVNCTSYPVGGTVQTNCR